MKTIEPTKTVWRLWECDKGSRWSSVIAFKGFNTQQLACLQPGSACEFSGCTTDHGVRHIRDTDNRTEAHNWFRRP